MAVTSEVFPVRFQVIGPPTSVRSRSRSVKLASMADGKKIAQNLPYQGGRPGSSYKWGEITPLLVGWNNFSYPIYFRPFRGVTSPFRTDRGPPCSHGSVEKEVYLQYSFHFNWGSHFATEPWFMGEMCFFGKSWTQKLRGRIIAKKFCLE